LCGRAAANASEGDTEAPGAPHRLCAAAEEAPARRAVFADDFRSEGHPRGLTPVSKTRWHLESIFVFEGDFTVEEDKDKLVNVVLGLWSLVDADTEGSETVDSLHELVQAHRDRVFPRRYFGKLIEVRSDCTPFPVPTARVAATPHGLQLRRLRARR
jgi:hypothetical protein